jgi:ParB/Sulfiredoxin domain
MTNTATWRDKYKVHPAADVFPMMSDEELRALGEDIKAHGLNRPIVLWLAGDDDWVLIDGRNRLEAMERAGVSRVWTDENEDDDPLPFIISANIRRRHLNKQQQADLIVAAHAAAPRLSPRWRKTPRGVASQ